MSTNSTRLRTHWGYFLALEEDAERLSRYIEFSESNMTTYSLEIARLLLTAASEIDVVARQLCSKINSDSKADNINEFAKEILMEYPHLNDLVVRIPRFDLEFQPWKHWTDKNSPPWWSSYNKIKHERHKNFEKATLENFLNALAGLFTLLLLLFKDEAEKGDFKPHCRLLEPSKPYELAYKFWAEGEDTPAYKLIMP